MGGPTPHPPEPPTQKTWGQIFFRAFGQSKIFSGAFGASQFRPKFFVGASQNSAHWGGRGGLDPPIQPPRPTHPPKRALGGS